MFQNEIDNIWNAVKEELKKRFAPSAYDLWVPVLKLITIDDDRAVLTCDSEFKLGIIKNRHINKIEDAFEAVLGYRVELDISATETETKPKDEVSIAAKDTASLANVKNVRDIDLDDVKTDNFLYHAEYTFDNFIVGGSNKFAHAACVAVAKDPGESYNPLFIYGPSGLGKTHLMYAVTNEIWRRNPKISLVYVKGEQFTNELIEAISTKSTSSFREKYRNTDVLLIDDVQFIGGKESTQEEMFHTFNALYENHKQIILTSDRPPKEIKVLEDRLKTRFEWGLLADIQPPDLELRSAIIKKKSEAMELELSPEVIAYLADRLKSNIRQIEGALKRLKAMSYLSGTKITVDVAARSLSDIVSEEIPLSSKISRVIGEVSSKYGFEEADLRGKKRTQELAWARHVAIYILRERTDMSWSAIGAEFGRDHSTIMASYKIVADEIESNPSFAVEMNELLNDVDI